MCFVVDRELTPHVSWCQKSTVWSIFKRSIRGVAGWQGSGARGQGGFVVIVGLHNGKQAMHAPRYKPLSGESHVPGRPFTVRAHPEHLATSVENLSPTSAKLR